MASRPEVDGLNAGYAALVLEQYLDNPAAVPDEWRAVFETSDRDELIAISRARPAARPPRGSGGALRGRPSEARWPVRPAAAPAEPAPAAVDEVLGGIAAAASLVKAFHMHGHLGGASRSASAWSRQAIRRSSPSG